MAQNSPSRAWFRYGTAVVALALLGVFVFRIVPRLFGPPRYVATVTMEVRPDTSPYLRHQVTASYDPGFMQVQMQVLRKRELLDPVIQSLHLENHYAENGGR